MRASRTEGTWGIDGSMGCPVRPARSWRARGLYWWGIGVALLGLGLAQLPAGAEGPPEGLGSSFLLGGSAEILPAFGDQTSPAFAYDTTGTGTGLIVWQDARSGEPDIYATLIDGSGSHLKSLPIALATGSSRQQAPAVAFGSGVFLVAWQSEEIDGWAIRGGLVSREGEILDGDIEIAAGRSPKRAPEIAFNGTDFMVVWSNGPFAASEVYGARVSSGGSVLNPGGRRLGGGDLGTRDPAVAFGAGRFLLVWSQAMQAKVVGDTARHGDIKGLFLDAAGAPMADTAFVVSAALTITVPDTTENDELAPEIGADGTNFLVVWRVKEQSFYGHLLDTTGTAIERIRPIPVITTSGTRGQARVAFDGTNYLVAWPLLVSAQGSGVSGARVSAADGTKLDANPLSLRTDHPEVIALEWLGDRYLLASSIGSAPGGYDILGRLVLPTGQIQELSAPTMSVGTPTQIACAVGSDGASYLVVWEQEATGGWVSLGARVNAEGTLQDPGIFPILPDVSVTRRNPNLVAGNAGYLLAWSVRQEGQGQVRAMLIDAAGQPLTAEVVAGTGQQDCRPGCAWDGARYLVAWRNFAESRYSVSGTGLALQDAELVPVDTLSSAYYIGSRACSDPSIVFDGANYFLTWAVDQQGILANWQAPSGGAPREPFALSGASTAGPPVVAFDGQLFYVLWEEGGKVYGTRVSRSGAALDPGRIRFGSPGTSEPPAVGAGGSAALTVWRTAVGPQWGLQGTRLTSDGRMLDVPAIEVADESPLQRWPILGSGPSDRMLLIYSRLINQDGISSLRIAGKTWFQKAPEVILSVHQNPGITSDVAVYLFPSETLAENTLTLHANGQPIDLEEIDPANGVWRGAVRAPNVPTVNLRAEARDLAGNFGFAERAFSIGRIPAREGGDLAGPNEEIRLHCPAGALTEDAFVMILPDADGSNPAGAAGFTLSPPDLALRRAVTLELRPPAPDAPEGWVLERETLEGWGQVQTLGLSPAGKLTAAIDALGHYRVRPAAGDVPDLTRLSLRVGPEPFRETLSIRYTLPHAGVVDLRVFDLNGRCVRALAGGHQDRGEHVSTWDGSDVQDRPVGCGVYFTRLAFEDRTWTQRCIRIR